MIRLIAGILGVVFGGIILTPVLLAYIIMTSPIIGIVWLWVRANNKDRERWFASFDWEVLVQA